MAKHVDRGSWFGISGAGQRMFATALFSALCLEHRATYIHRFSTTSVIDYKSVVELRDQTWSADRRQTLCHRPSHHPWMPATNERDFAVERDGAEDKAGAADLLTSCVRMSAYQLASGSSTLQQVREQREARSARKLAVSAKSKQW